MLELLRKLNELKRTPRVGWASCSIPLPLFEDVAQHTFEVASLSLLLSRELELNELKVLKMAIVHDWPEALVGDISYSATAYLGKETKNKAEEKALQNLLGDRKELLEVWKEFKENRTLESRLVHFCDYFAILIQALYYFEGGNRSPGLKELCNNVKGDLEPYFSTFPQFRSLVNQVLALLKF
jgi:putative hydrolase of HD superfamily